MPDLQSGVIETRICNPHHPHGSLRYIISGCLRIANPQLGYAGLQIQRDKVTKSALIRENLRFFLLSFH